MGGSVLVAVKRGSGEEVVMERHTNSVPYWICRPTFLTDGSDLDEYIASARGKLYGSPMRRKTIYPSQYGVILIDIPNKRVLNRNGYCEVPRILFSPSIAVREEVELICMMAEAGVIGRVTNASLGSNNLGSVVGQEEVDAVVAWCHLRQAHRSARVLAGIGPEIRIHDARFRLSDRDVGDGSYAFYVDAPDWEIDNGDGPPTTEWDVVRDWLKENDWQSKAWTTSRVIRKYEEE